MRISGLIASRQLRAGERLPPCLIEGDLDLSGLEAPLEIQPDLEITGNVSITRSPGIVRLPGRMEIGGRLQLDGCVLRHNGLLIDYDSRRLPMTLRTAISAMVGQPLRVAFGHRLLEGLEILDAPMKEVWLRQSSLLHVVLEEPVFRYLQPTRH